ncbi:MAG: sn-glycerol-3-phosphate ABC transporter ATP-binding protein UgpC [Acidimicrobiales bacterium]|jgi:multiple sugar transport system ATP-binding protein
MATISLEAVHKTYPNGFEAIKGIDLFVSEGEFMVLVGPSGCGKTTLLRMVAGLEEISSGVLRIGDTVMNEVAPKDRDIAMVFQNYALYPHMTVAQNIGFALKLRRMPRPEIRRRVEQAAALMGLTEFLQQRPGQLSGGQRQRVAMGRALVREPVAFLMDEPLSNLDARLRVQMRAEISRLQRRLGVATIYVTHDQTEAMTMGDRVAVLRAGTVRQCDVPQQLFDRPADLFVGGFIGSPAMNLYRAGLGSGARTLRLGSQTIDLPDSLVRVRPGLADHCDAEVIVGFRPEYLRIGGEADKPGFIAEIDIIEPLGSELLVHFSLDAVRVTSEEGETGEPPALGSAGFGIAKVPAPGMTMPRPGERLPFVFPPDQIHFFDPESHLAIWQ